MRYSPAQVIAIENMKESPFCCTFGCCEIETVAEKVINWLADNGNSWDIPLPELSMFGSPHDLKHGHWMGAEYASCDFCKEFVNIDTGVVNSDFVSCCTKLDGRRIKQSILNKLRPDLFQD